MDKNLLQGLIVVVSIAVVWGYFKDIQNGDIGWFIGRIVVSILVYYVVYQTILRNKKQKKA